MGEADYIGKDGQAFENIAPNVDGTPVRAEVVVGRELIFVTGAFARPADTTAYAANDTVSNSTGTATASLLNFGLIGGQGQSNNSGYIVKAILVTNQAACVARFRLHLFNLPPSAQGDNAPHTLLFADNAKRIGYIDFPSTAQEGTGSTGAQALVVIGSGNLPFPFQCVGSADLWGILETLDAFTPASGQQFFVGLGAEVT